MLNQFELIRVFCAAAESRSFREAASKLGKSPQAVTRSIRELEALRGEILFYRTTRNSKITREGESLARQAKVLLGNIDALIGHAEQDDASAISGHVSLTLPSALGRRLVIPVLTAFQHLHPAVDISCTLTDAHSNVISEQIDIGLRTGFVRDNRFVSRKVLDVNFYLVGAPELIAKTGAPRSLTELAAMPAVALYDQQSNRYWPWGFESGSYTPASPRFVTDDLDAYCEALKEGLGFGQIPGFIALPLIRSGRLIPVMQDEKSVTWGLYLYRPQTGPVPQRIRLLFDYLSERLSDIIT